MNLHVSRTLVSAALALWTSVALAGPPTADELTLRYANALRLDGDGASLRLLDRYGDEVRTDDALTIIGRPSEAAAYHRAHGLRTAAAITCLSVGGVSALMAVNAGQAVLEGHQEAADYTRLGATFGVGVLGLGTAAAAKYNDPRAHLGAWVERPVVEAGVAAWNTRVTSPGPGDAVTETRHRDGLAPRLYHLDPDGWVVDGRDNRVTTSKLVTALHDDAWRASLDARHQQDRARWTVITAVGGTTAGIGAIGAFSGIIRHYDAYGNPAEQHQADAVMFAAGVVTTVGVGVAGAGVGGALIARAWREAPTFWYDPAVLGPRLDAYDAALLAPPPGGPTPVHEPAAPGADPSAAPGAPLATPPGGGTARLHIYPIVGPMIGVTGTF